MTDMNAALSTVEAENQRMMSEAVGEEFEIFVKNNNSSAKTTCMVYPENTLGQVYEYCVNSIGLLREAKGVYFFNERTRKSTSRSAATIKDLDLQQGDVLGVAMEGVVAAK